MSGLFGGDDCRKSSRDSDSGPTVKMSDRQKTWDVTNWVLQLFFQFLDNSTAKILHRVDHEDSPNKSTVNDGPEPQQSSFNTISQTAACPDTFT
ncbi:hypothetical protein VE02_09279 [Pseudogymnoascus sp. 03VT05]|nr:hypothetical protein VE02_09279 [Pseudogymnoascus sp. 03VT05]